MVFICGVIMATFKSEFQDLAAELIDEEFADFRRALTFTIITGGTLNPSTGAVTGGTTTVYSYQAIPQPLDIKEFQGTDVAVTDTLIVYTRTDAFKPSVDARCVYDGRNMQVIQAMYDAADATVKLVLRGL
jgi:hypothetical protein